MSRFKTPLARRMRKAEGLRLRYWNDPAYRLHKVNYRRLLKGMAPRVTVDEIESQRA